jgi:hypothetical protein
VSNRADGITTVEKIEQQYPDEWVLVEVTKFHNNHGRIRGRLLAHDTDRDRVHDTHMDFVAKHPEAMTYVFFTGDVVAPGVVAVL